MTLYLSSTAYVYIRINGQWLPQVYIPKWFGYHIINIPAVMLNCGCKNIIEFYSFGFSNAYPIAISYGFSQDCRNAMNCPNPLSYYNRNTCQCECSYPRTCNWPFYYSLTDCGCVCYINQQQCPSNKIFNRNTCSCECRWQNCPRGYILNQWTCTCERGGRNFDDFGVDTVSVPLTSGPDLPPFDTNSVGGGFVPFG